MSTSGTWNLWWAFHWIQLKAAAVQRPWEEAMGTLPKVPMPWHPPVLVIAVWDEWWEGWESGTYTIHSGMARVFFYLPHHRTLSTRHPQALFHAIYRLPGQFWKFLGSPHRGRTQTFSTVDQYSTTRPLSYLLSSSISLLFWLAIRQWMASLAHCSWSNFGSHKKPP